MIYITQPGLEKTYPKTNPITLPQASDGWDCTMLNIVKSPLSLCPIPWSPLPKQSLKTVTVTVT